MIDAEDSTETERQARRRRQRELAALDERIDGARRADEAANNRDLETLLFVDEMLSHEQRLQRLGKRLTELDRLSREALEEADLRVKRAKERLDDVHARANVTADGRRIYRTADGKRAFYENGVEATADEIAAVTWKKDGPTWEQRQDGARNWNEAVIQQDKARERVERIQEIKKQVESGQVTRDELEQLERETANMSAAMNDALGSRAGTRRSAAAEHAPDGSFSKAPDAAGAFLLANTTPVEQRPDRGATSALSDPSKPLPAAAPSGPAGLQG